MYGLVKTHIEGNPVRVVTSGRGAAIENLSIFVEKCLYSEVLNIECRVQDTSEMLTIIDHLNSSNSLISDCKLVSFDIINKFPSIDNISGLKSVKKVLESRSNQFPPSNCIIEALKLCLESNNSIFNNKHYLQSDGTAQGPHMSCSYSDKAIQYFDINSLELNPPVICWKRFRDNIFVVWPHTLEELQVSFNYMNNIDQSKKIQFIMEVAKDSLEFLDLKLMFDKESKKISVDVFSKLPTVLHMYFLILVFLKVTSKTFLKELHCVYEESVILTINLKSVVKNIKTTSLLEITNPGK